MKPQFSTFAQESANALSVNPCRQIEKYCRATAAHEDLLEAAERDRFLRLADAMALVLEMQPD